jgi:hypothetical protein
MIIVTEAECCDPTEQHLYPCSYWQRFAYNAVCEDEVFAHATLEAALEVESEVYA